MFKGFCREFCGCAAIALVSSVCVLKPSVCSEMFCDSWPKAVYQLGDHLMDDVGGKSVYVACKGRLVEHFTDVILPFQSFCITWPFWGQSGQNRRLGDDLETVFYLFIRQWRGHVHLVQPPSPRPWRRHRQGVRTLEVGWAPSGLSLLGDAYRVGRALTTHFQNRWTAELIK